ncbi:terminase small subunit [Planctomycetota bacterium]
MIEETELTPKQKSFCEEYLVDMNGTQAAIRAGYSKHTATVIAYENLIKPYVRSYVQKLIAERSTRSEITADK